MKLRTSLSIAVLSLLATFAGAQEKPKVPEQTKKAPPIPTVIKVYGNQQEDIGLSFVSALVGGLKDANFAPTSEQEVEDDGYVKVIIFVYTVTDAKKNFVSDVINVTMTVQVPGAPVQFYVASSIVEITGPDKVAPGAKETVKDISEDINQFIDFMSSMQSKQDVPKSQVN